MTAGESELSDTLESLMRMARACDMNFEVALLKARDSFKFGVQLLPSSLKPETAKIAIIQHKVSQAFSIDIGAMTMKRGREIFSTPRMIAMALSYEMIPNVSLGAVGDQFGGRNHGTVLNAVKRLNEMTETGEINPALITQLRAEIEQAIQSLKQAV